MQSSKLVSVYSRCRTPSIIRKLPISRCLSTPPKRNFTPSPFILSSTQVNCASSRSFHKSTITLHLEEDIDPNAPDVHVTFLTPEGESIPVTGKVGQSLLGLAHSNYVDLEGACEGSVACSTCHVVLPANIFEMLPEPSDEENDMLDMAFGLTETSRLGCQVKLDTNMEGMLIKIPAATRNMMVDKQKK